MSSTQRLPRVTTEAYAWQRHAACRGSSSELFFGPADESAPARQRREERAKAVCATCPVQSWCLEHAVAAAEPYGIWGGLATRERGVGKP
ncbi:WhiB family transcriptional regulator [Bounagaea algeriensis]